MRRSLITLALLFLFLFLVLPLAVTSAERSALLPDVPAIAETLPGFEVVSAYGILAPARTPREIVVKLNTVMGLAIISPDFKKQFEGDGVELFGGTPEQFAERIKGYLPHYAKLVQLAGIKPE